MRKAPGSPARAGTGGKPSLRAMLDDSVGSTRWREQLRDIIALVESSMPRGPVAPPAPVAPPREQPLGYTLADAAISSPRAVEGYARGALAAGHAVEELLAWASPRADHPAEAAAAEAVMLAVIRDRGYEPALAWAALPDPADPVQAFVPPPGMEPAMFVVPRRPYLFGRAVARKFAAEYPYTVPALEPLRVAGGDRAMFRPELVPALADEQAFQSAMSRMTRQEYEDVILPLSRIPGFNALVLVALLLDEILDPMEILGWIGADIRNPPRTGVADRPEDILVLEPPGTVVGGLPRKYMIFSDTHRDAPQDADFRIDHFTGNAALYLRALEWCDAEGYTVLENGDCEELWYEPTFDPALRQSKIDRFTDILLLHQPVYQKLDDLAGRGRHFRSIGNHDSYLWEDPALLAWRAANPFPALHGGFVIPGCKPMDDFWPHIGLNALDYTKRADMLIVHGHHFDFWNCDEHNRLGKFITNAAAVPADALDDILYDYRGIDRLGHPLVEFWDVLARYTPWNNWPAKDVAREWAEALEVLPLANNLTADSISFSETLAAAIAFLMNSGGFDLFNMGVILCIGHTHNPQSRPWIPYLSGYNPWRTKELFGERVFENLFAIKTRYLNSGTVGWWEDLIWAIEITENGLPRLVYWSSEDMSPVGMDWELEDEGAIPGSPLPALEDWADEYLTAEAARLLRSSAAAASSASSAAAAASAAGMQRLVEIVGGPDGVVRRPDVTTLERILAATTPAGLVMPGVGEAVAHAALSTSVLRSAKEGNRAVLAALTLAARQNPAIGGLDPRSRPPALAGADAAAAPPQTPLGRLLWPRLLEGASPVARDSSMGAVDVLRALYSAYAPPATGRPAPGQKAPRAEKFK